MKTTLLIVLIAAAVSASQLGYHGRSLYSSRFLERQEKASGLCYEANSVICSQDCKQVYLCVIDESSWSPILIENCTANTYCNGRAGTCQKNLSTCSPTDPAVYQFHCTATGSFPDPYDCSVYHKCPNVGDLSTPKACQSGWSYNALTTECDHSLSQGVCFPSGEIPACSSPGQSGAVPENTNIYFVCVKSESGGLVHELYKCAHGGHYADGKCTPP